MLPFGNDHPFIGSTLFVASPTKVTPQAPTVLIIDHDAAVRDALSVLLRTSGFGVLSFESAGHFLDARPRVQRGCLLIEFDLKDMKATELIARLSAERLELPAIIMSARLHNPFLKHPLPQGVTAVLQKPFGRDELIKNLRLTIGN